MRTWTEAEIVEWLKLTDRDGLARALKSLWKRQTYVERECHATLCENGVGFNSYDAGFAGKMVEWTNSGKTFSKKQAEAVRRMLRKYRKQLTELANERRK